MFVDPLCPECWALEPIIKKLQLEFGQYFRLKHVLSSSLTRLNINSKKIDSIAQLWEKTATRTGMSCDGNLWFDNPITAPYITSIAIKAAELQGRRAGIRFLRKIQELLFLEKQNVSNLDVLVECANSINLDTEEFLNDIHSESAAKAFQCDLKILSEMEVNEFPSLVFFNENIEDEGLKITGLYEYNVYVQIIQEMLGTKTKPNPLPPLEQFLKIYKLVASKEIAIVYDMSITEVEKKLKKWVLQQKVKAIPGKHGTFWKYIENED
ncbi:DsbA family protein [Heyndrickxia vini]|uniref:ClpXP adapter protein SpxH n=2 Tax=Heyndrickxia vini TaxID=1476025 RepID=A0ABX7E9B9_9BACI|nr:DsbA family protein [Heyndrickxia vini]